MGVNSSVRCTERGLQADLNARLHIGILKASVFCSCEFDDLPMLFEYAWLATAFRIRSMQTHDPQITIGQFIGLGLRFRVAMVLGLLAIGAYAIGSGGLAVFEGSIALLTAIDCIKTFIDRLQSVGNETK